jgi:hypothetical protein
MIELIVAFRNFVNALREQSFMGKSRRSYDLSHNRVPQSGNVPEELRGLTITAQPTTVNLLVKKPLELKFDLRRMWRLPSTAYCSAPRPTREAVARP